MTTKLTALLVPLLAACTTIGNAAPPLVPSKWVFVSIDGQPPVSDRASLSLEPGQIGASVGCNGMGGGLRIKGNRLIAGPMMATQMYCDGKMEQERAVSELLGASPIFVYQGQTLKLKSAKHRAELKRID
jgi:heat shock protein HslJ